MRLPHRLILLGILVPLASVAQRSSISQVDGRLASAETELSRAEAALCAKADADGETYRPYFCSPRCDCLPLLAGAISCDEPSPGRIEVSDGTGVIMSLDPVVAADAPDTVVCDAGGTRTDINSNDALECIEQIETTTGLECP